MSGPGTIMGYNGSLCIVRKKTVTFFQIFTVFSVHMNFTNQEDCTPKETSYEFRV